MSKLNSHSQDYAGGGWSTTAPVLAWADGTSDEPFSLPPGFFAGLQLKGVSAVAQSCELSAGRMTLTSLEAYEDGTILNYLVVADESMQQDRHRMRDRHRLRDPRLFERATDEERRAMLEEIPTFPGEHLFFEIEDDLGTNYGCSPRGSHGNDTSIRGSFGFTPPIPESAKQLQVTVFEGRWAFEDGHLKNYKTEAPVAIFVLDL
jgi:hypothetical protein